MKKSGILKDTRRVLKIKNTKERYGIISICFHWVMAIIVIALIGIGIYMAESEWSDKIAKLYSLHKSFGVLILMLVIFRIIWNFSNKESPTLPDNLPKWQNISAKISHSLLYLLLFIIPISGCVMSLSAGYSISFFGLFNLPEVIPANSDIKKIASLIHEYSAFFLMFLIIVHAGAALQHHFFYKDNILKRMLP